MQWGCLKTPSHRRTGLIHQGIALVNGISATASLETPDFAGIFTVEAERKRKDARGDHRDL